jgi:hypothetical protein
MQAPIVIVRTAIADCHADRDPRRYIERGGRGARDPAHTAAVHRPSSTRSFDIASKESSRRRRAGVTIWRDTTGHADED